MRTRLVAIAYLLVLVLIFWVVDLENALSLALACVSVPFGFALGRWRALGLAGGSFLALGPLAFGDGTDTFGPLAFYALFSLYLSAIALLGLAIGVGVRKLIDRGTRGTPRARYKPARRRPLLLLPAALVAAGCLLWLDLAWFLLASGLDPHTSCQSAPCLGAPAEEGTKRDVLDALYGVAQMVLTLVGVTSGAVLTASLSGRALGSGSGRWLGRGAAVAASAAGLWLAYVALGTALRREDDPARAALAGEVVPIEGAEQTTKSRACRMGMPFTPYSLGTGWEGYQLAGGRCVNYSSGSTYELGYRLCAPDQAPAQCRSLGVSTHSACLRNRPQFLALPEESRRMNSTPTVARQTTVAGVPAVVVEVDDGVQTLELFTGEATVSLLWEGASRDQLEWLAGALRPVDRESRVGEPGPLPQPTEAALEGRLLCDRPPP